MTRTPNMIAAVVLAVVTIIASLCLACSASAQWADPGGTWRGTNAPRYNYVAVRELPPSVAPALSEQTPDVVPSDVISEVTVEEVVVVQKAEIPEVPVVVEIPAVVPPRPIVPPNPYENLPPGSILPPRPVVPDNPYDHLPPGVTVPRPPVPHPCGFATPAWCPGGVYDPKNSTV